MNEKPKITQPEPVHPNHELALRFLKGDDGGPVHLRFVYDGDTDFFVSLSWMVPSGSGWTESHGDGFEIPIQHARALHAYLGSVLSLIDKDR